VIKKFLKENEIKIKNENYKLHSFFLFIKKKSLFKQNFTNKEIINYCNKKNKKITIFFINFYFL